MHRWRIGLVVVTLATSACVQAAAQRSGSSSAEPPVAGDVTVFAAASLTEAFEQIGQAFEAEHPSATLRFNFAGSQQLAAQIVEGAPADVFASADRTQMDVIEAAAGAASEPETFAGNDLQIVVERGNPRNVTGLDDLADDRVTVVLAAEEVPAGRYTRQVLEAAGVPVSPVSLEANVRAVLSKVSLGEADAGIVYTSDVVAAGAAVTGVEIADDSNVSVAYPAALVEDGPNLEAGQAFLDLLTSPRGRRILQDLGFSAP